MLSILFCKLILTSEFSVIFEHHAQATNIKLFVWDPYLLLRFLKKNSDQIFQFFILNEVNLFEVQTASSRINV